MWCHGWIKSGLTRPQRGLYKLLGNTNMEEESERVKCMLSSTGVKSWALASCWCHLLRGLIQSFIHPALPWQSQQWSASSYTAVNAVCGNAQSVSGHSLQAGGSQFWADGSVNLPLQYKPQSKSYLSGGIIADFGVRGDRAGFVPFCVSTQGLWCFQR